jgi:hypothetical protein
LESQAAGQGKCPSFPSRPVSWVFWICRGCKSWQTRRLTWLSQSLTSWGQKATLQGTLSHPSCLALALGGSGESFPGIMTPFKHSSHLQCSCVALGKTPGLGQKAWARVPNIYLFLRPLTSLSLRLLVYE